MLSVNPVVELAGNPIVSWTLLESEVAAQTRSKVPPPVVTLVLVEVETIGVVFLELKKLPPRLEQLADARNANKRPEYFKEKFMA